MMLVLLIVFLPVAAFSWAFGFIFGVQRANEPCPKWLLRMFPPLPPKGPTP